MGVVSRILQSFNRNRYGILTGHEINRQVEIGRIKISPYSVTNINPNSYNISLSDKFLIYNFPKVIDLKDPSTYSDYHEVKIPEDGIILRPGLVYLISTMERISTDYYEPIITGRSSIGRLGISVHQEAGFGDIGYDGTFTFHLKVTYPTKIYPHITIGQVYFLTPCGEITKLYNGKYNKSNSAVASKWGIDGFAGAAIKSMEKERGNFE